MDIRRSASPVQVQVDGGDARDVAGMVAFFDEKVDVIFDGVRRERRVTPWS